MAIREALLVLAVILAIAALGLAMGREEGEPLFPQAHPKRDGSPLPPDHPPLARHEAPAGAAFKPREALALAPNGLVDTDPHIAVDQYSRTIEAYWSEVRGGDARHAYELAFLLGDCQLARDFQKGTQDEQLRATLAARVSQCAGVGAELLEHRFQLLELAARRGDVRAQTEFGTWPPERLRTAEPALDAERRAWEAKAVGFWQSAAERGSARAMAMLAAGHRDGSLGLPADGASALGYYLSVTALAPRWRDPGARRVYESRVSIEERERAFELHRHLMARCCEALP